MKIRSTYDLPNNVCRRCAECCKHFPYIRLSKIEIQMLEEITSLHIDVFVDTEGKSSGVYFLKFKANGDCLFLKNEEGSYSCSVYDSRPSICKKFPSTPVQKEFCSKKLSNLADNFNFTAEAEGIDG